MLLRQCLWLILLLVSPTLVVLQQRYFPGNRRTMIEEGSIALHICNYRCRWWCFYWVIFVIDWGGEGRSSVAVTNDSLEVAIVTQVALTIYYSCDTLCNVTQYYVSGWLLSIHFCCIWGIWNIILQKKSM